MGDDPTLVCQGDARAARRGDSHRECLPTASRAAHDERVPPPVHHHPVQCARPHVAPAGRGAACDSLRGQAEVARQAGHRGAQPGRSQRGSGCRGGGGSPPPFATASAAAADLSTSSMHDEAAAAAAAVVGHMQRPPVSHEEEGASTFLGTSDDRPASAPSPPSVDHAVEGDDDAFDEFAATYGGRGGEGGYAGAFGFSEEGSVSAAEREEASSPPPPPLVAPPSDRASPELQTLADPLQPRSLHFDESGYVAAAQAFPSYIPDEAEVAASVLGADQPSHDGALAVAEGAALEREELNAELVDLDANLDLTSHLARENSVSAEINRALEVGRARAALKIQALARRRMVTRTLGVFRVVTIMIQRNARRRLARRRYASHPRRLAAGLIQRIARGRQVRAVLSESLEATRRARAVGTLLEVLRSKHANRRKDQIKRAVGIHYNVTLDVRADQIVDALRAARSKRWMSRRLLAVHTKVGEMREMKAAAEREAAERGGSGGAGDFDWRAALGRVKQWDEGEAMLQAVLDRERMYEGGGGGGGEEEKADQAAAATETGATASAEEGAEEGVDKGGEAAASALAPPPPSGTSSGADTRTASTKHPRFELASSDDSSGLTSSPAVPPLYAEGEDSWRSKEGGEYYAQNPTSGTTPHDYSPARETGQSNRSSCSMGSLRRTSSAANSSQWSSRPNSRRNVQFAAGPDGRVLEQTVQYDPADRAFSPTAWGGACASAMPSPAEIRGAGARGGGGGGGGVALRSPHRTGRRNRRRRRRWRWRRCWRWRWRCAGGGGGGGGAGGGGGGGSAVSSSSPRHSEGSVSSVSNAPSPRGGARGGPPGGESFSGVPLAVGEASANFGLAARIRRGSREDDLISQSSHASRLSRRLSGRSPRISTRPKFAEEEAPYDGKSPLPLPLPPPPGTSSRSAASAATISASTSASTSGDVAGAHASPLAGVDWGRSAKALVEEAEAIAAAASTPRTADVLGGGGGGQGW